MVENTKRTLRERLRDRFAERERMVEGEQGSLILDILIGMAIFALIAVIAVSGIGQYRARAYTQSAVSDAQALGLAYEAYITDQNGTYAAPTQATNVVTLGNGETVLLSHGGKNVMYWNVLPTAVNGYTFIFCIAHDASEYAVYDSSRGGIVKSARSGATGQTAYSVGPPLTYKCS